MIKKNKVMIQIPVRTGVAKTWKNLVKESGYSQEELFVTMFAGFLHEISKGGEVHGKEKDNKKDNKKVA